jgi:hypothetical protein
MPAMCNDSMSDLMLDVAEDLYEQLVGKMRLYVVIQVHVSNTCKKK